MTVASTIAKAGPYAGSGTTGPFPVTFRFLEDSHLQVIRTSAAGVATTLALTTDYTVSGAGLASGSVTTVAALPVGETLTVLRSVPATQETDYVQGDRFPAESHEKALDKLTMIAQQQGEILSRAITVPTGESSVPSLPAAADRANTLLGFDANGDPVVTTPNPTDATAVSLALLEFIGDVADTADAGKGDALVGVKQPFAGSVARTQHQKNQDFVTVEDFGAVGDGVTDDSAAFQAAHDSGQAIWLGMGKKYMLSTTITANASAKSFRFLSPARTARGGKNDPFADLTGPVIEWTGAVGAPVFSIDVYNSQHTDIQGISFVVPNGYTAAAINVQGGPFFSTGGIQSGWLQGLAVYRQGAISPQTTTARLLNFDCSGSLADGRVIGGWVMRDLFAFNTQNAITVTVGNNAFGTPGLDNWWNSNLIEDVYGYQVYRLIDLTAGTTNGNAIWRNTFRNCTNQPGKGLDTLFATGACIRGANLTQYNNLDHCTAWDLSSGTEFALPETNMRRGFFGDYFSHTEGLQMYGPTAADIIKSLRPGWLNSYRLRSFGNNGGRMMLSNNYDGTSRDTTSLHAAALNLQTDGAASSFDIYLGAASVAKRFAFEFDGTNTKAGFHGAAAVAKPTVTGAKGGNAALTSLIAALASYGLITDSTT